MCLAKPSIPQNVEDVTNANIYMIRYIFSYAKLSFENILNVVHNHIMTGPPLHRHCHLCLFYRFTIITVTDDLRSCFFLAFLYYTPHRYILLFFLVLLLLWLVHMLRLLFVFDDVTLYSSLLLVLSVHQMCISESRPGCTGLSDAVACTKG